MLRRTFLALPLAARAATSSVLYLRLLRAVANIETIDTHEHILPEAQRVREPIGFFTLAGHYLMNDLVAAGLSAEGQRQIESAAVPLTAKWKLFEPYWRQARFTGYAEALRIAVADIYGFREISGATIASINGAIAKRNKPGLYREILKRRAKLRFCVNDQYWQPTAVAVDAELFVLAQKFDQFVMPVTPAGVQRLEKQASTSITNLAGLKHAMEKVFALALAAGMVTVKSTAAYQRDLRFSEVTEADAARDFERLLKGNEPAPAGFRQLERRPFRQLADHMFHHLLGLADAYRVPVQIHTGLQAGNGNFVAHSRPADLTNLFFLFPRVEFDLFHIGYPYWRECAVLAKTFANVYVDFCWMHIVSPTGARAALHEMLDSVPASKIFGFGGDYRYPELSYGHLVMARRNIARVLAERVETGANTEQESVELARWLLHDNPARLFAPRKR